MSALPKMLARSPRPIMVPAGAELASLVVRSGGLARMDVSTSWEAGQADLTGAVVADWLRSGRSWKK